MRTTLRGRRNRFAWIDELSRRLQLDGDQWHDARLVDLSIAMPGRPRSAGGHVTLRIEAYGDLEHAGQRTPIVAMFGGVRDVVSTLNCAELAGTDDHVVFARLNDTAEMLDLSIYVAGGHVRIVAERLVVSTRLPRRAGLVRR